MEATKIELRHVPGEDGYTVARPSKITVEMTIQEAVALAHVANHFTSGTNWAKASGTEIGKLGEHHARPIREACSSIYGGLVGDVIHRYYDDGVDEALEELNR